MYSPKNDVDPPRIIVPAGLRHNLLKIFHESESMGGHVSRTKMYDKFVRRFWYRGVSSDISRFCRSCFLCRTIKPSPPYNQGYLELFPPSEVGEYVECDIFGPLPRTISGSAYIVVLVDRLSRWVEFIATPDIRTETVCDVIVNEWIFRYGVMKILLTDRGSQFTSDLLQKICKKLDIKLNIATASNHRAVGTAERLMKYLANFLAMFVNKSHTNWDSFLGSASFIYRTSVVPSIGHTPAELTFGRQLRLPVDLMFGKYDPAEPNIDDYYNKLCRKMDISFKNALQVQKRTDLDKKKFHDRHQINIKFAVDDLVLFYTEPKSGGGLTKKFKAKFSGPHRIKSVISDLNYEIVELKSGKTQIVHIRRLLKYEPFKDEFQRDNSECLSGTEGGDEMENVGQSLVTIKKVIAKRTTQYGPEFLAVFSNGIQKWVEPLWIPHNLREEFERQDRQNRADKRG